jgi:hypothetical protein
MTFHFLFPVIPVPPVVVTVQAIANRSRSKAYYVLKRIRSFLKTMTAAVKAMAA